MRRTVQPEILDTLPADSPDAQHSRLDLRRINGLMGHRRRLTRHLNDVLPPANRPWRVLELGVGDGLLSSQIWKRLPAPPAGSQMVLLDQVPVVEAKAKEELGQRGWQVEQVLVDAFVWLEEANDFHYDIVYSNLFIHHFDQGALVELLRLIARRSRAFVTLEPRRSFSSELGVRGLSLLGSHPVTLHDAHRSVLAGFTNDELSRAWPETYWQLQEGRAGLFSHYFVARRAPGT
ncbi:MAG: methyltransferase domain-containing protein [Verrucomicrobia bacterium]|nr:methyltransferase domain-containing protein [Verrucomicrobiota bacterium]